MKRNDGQEKSQKVTEKEEKLISQSNKNRFSQIRGKNGPKFASNDLSKEPAEAEKEIQLSAMIQKICENCVPDPNSHSQIPLFTKAFVASVKEKSIDAIDEEMQSIFEKVRRDILKVFEASKKEESTEREKEIHS